MTLRSVFRKVLLAITLGCPPLMLCPNPAGAAKELVICVKPSKKPGGKPVSAFTTADKCPEPKFKKYFVPGDFLCWDKNRDGVCQPDENTNGDKKDDGNGNLVENCTPADCQAPECWDTNKNLICDPKENINGDKNPDGTDKCDNEDCKSPECWDLNKNLRCDPDENKNKDTNSDGST